MIKIILGNEIDRIHNGKIIRIYREDFPLGNENSRYNREYQEIYTKSNNRFYRENYDGSISG